MTEVKTEEPKEISQPGSNEDVKDNKNDADDEKTEENNNKNSGLLDVAFVLDCTGSMSAYIQSCKDNILSISNKISEEVKDCNVQFALVMYRDIPPQDKTFITKKLDFTPIPFKIKIELESVRAKGGGDHPECLTSALYDCKTNLKWRKDAIKVIIVITDAPPHGLETKGNDGFPDGDPDTFGQNDLEGDVSSGKIDKKKTLNLIEIVQSIRDDLEAAIYSVACEPDLSCNSDFAHDFMRYMSEYTEGRFLPLSSAELLPAVIVGSVKQQINMNNLKNNLDDVIKEIKKEHGDDISGDKLNKIIMQKWKEAGVKKKEISIGTLYRKERSRENIELLMNGQKIKSLKDFKANAKMLGRLKRSDFRHLDIGKSSTKKVYEKEPIRKAKEVHRHIDGGFDEFGDFDEFGGLEEEFSHFSDGVFEDDDHWSEDGGDEWGDDGGDDWGDDGGDDFEDGGSGDGDLVDDCDDGGGDWGLDELTNEPPLKIKDAKFVVKEDLNEDWGDFGDEKECDNRSDSGAPQAYYSDSCSLDENDIIGMLKKNKN